ncbi:MAG: DegV family protein [Clostridia bacterium]|nr:DegV family protein [Clostridia bacterium]
MSIRIVVDSTADVAQEIQKRLTVVPLNVSFGQETYIDGVTIDHREFYEMLAESRVLPTTSQPSPDAYARVFEEAKAAGDELVVLTVSSGISGTYQSAMIAAQDYPENVYIVDSLNVAVALGALAEYALELVDRGMSAAEIAKELEAAREDVVLLALLDTLENLKKGGRIPPVLAFAGGLLSLKPILWMKDGRLEMLSKGRGIKQGYGLLLKEIDALGGVDFSKPFYAGYTGVSDASLEKFLESSCAVWEQGGKPVRRTQLCRVVGTHAGPGAVVLGFFRRK